MKGLFELGQVVATPQALSTLGTIKLHNLITRHATGDFGDLCEEDIETNKRAIKSGEDRVLSAYIINEDKFYVITEWDRSVTTVLFADEY